MRVGNGLDVYKEIKESVSKLSKGLIDVTHKRRKSQPLSSM